MPRSALGEAASPRSGRRLAWGGDGELGALADPDAAAWESGLEPALAGLAGSFSLAWSEPRARKLVLFRDAGSGERLFWRRSGERVLFATRVDALERLAGESFELDSGALGEQLLLGQVVVPPRTLWRGVREAAPGELLEFAGKGGPRSRAVWSPPGSEPPLDEPGRLLAELSAAVEGALGGEREALVSLSGGADSAGIAALAARALGAGRVTAVTLEYDDPEHPSEWEAAAATARALGLRHERVRLRFEEFLADVPRAFLLAEDVAIVSRARLAALSRFAAGAGRRRLLTGHGLEALDARVPHAAELGARARALERCPCPAAFLALWRGVFGVDCRRWWRLLPLVERAFPGLAAPSLPVYHLAALALADRGLARAESFYPGPLRALLAESLDASPGALVPGRSWPLEEQLRWLAFLRWQGRFLRGKAAWTRAAGAVHLAPACFLLGRRAAELRRPAAGPGRVSRAFEGLLPDEIRLRRKALPVQAVPPRSWIDRAVDALGPAARAGERTLDGALPGWRAAAAVLERDLAPYSLHFDMPAFGRDNGRALALWAGLRARGVLE